jgi:hypothetical protein
MYRWTPTLNAAASNSEGWAHTHRPGPSGPMNATGIFGIRAPRIWLLGLKVVQHVSPSLTELGQLSAQRQLSDNP